MKKLLFFIALLAIAASTHAQSVTLSVTTAPCNNDGVLTATVTGLTPPLTVTWNTMGITGTTIVHTVSGLTDALTSYSGGPINISVTDGTGWAYNSFSGAPPFTYTTFSTPAACPAPGSGTATVAGGTAPYTYQWFDVFTMTTVSTANPATLPAGSYGLTITDAAGCVYGSMVDVDSLEVYDTSGLMVSTAVTTASCTNGTATVTTVSGATSPISYLWTTGATSIGLTGLTMGLYTVTVTDALGCTGTGYAYVPQSITISVPVTATPATCIASDGAITAFGSGGMPPYAYLWSNGATTQSQTGLPAGYLGVSVTDANGCIGGGGGNVIAATPITVTGTSTASSCTSPTGTATIVPVGGTTPYSIIWYTTPTQTTATATALAAGTYGFKVTDALGCIRTGSVVVNPVNMINSVFLPTSATCMLSNGSLSVTASGGTTPYSYSWSTGSTASSISSVPAGSYGVTITDAIGCSIHRFGTVPRFSPMSVGVSTTPASCLYNSDGTATATAWGGTAPYTYSWGGSGTITGLPTGPRYVSVTDAIGCTASRFLHVGYNPSNTSCYCTINGTIYEDANGNCIQDAGEAGLHNVQVSCSGRGYTYTNSTGNYSFLVPTGTYTVTETVKAFHPLASCQANNIVVSVTAATGCVNTVNFANTTTPIHDIHISNWGYNMPVPGETYNQVTVVTNDGTVTESTIVSGYTTDGQMFSPSFVPSTIYSGTPYWYTSGAFPTLAPGAAQTIYNNYTVPTTLPMGTTLVFKDTAAWQAPISTWLTDYSPWNNVNYYTTTCVASYDPNFKEVNPKGTGAAGIIGIPDTILEYMVHFQNLGTYKAKDVVVLDTIDNNLNWTTLKPIYQSHKCKVTLTQVGPHKIARFAFNNIDLPAKQDDDLRSNGMFTYTIKRNPGLAIGAQMKNSASIYFDYNEPVKTNTTLNTIGSGVSIDETTTAELSHGTFVIYPNPAQNSFTALINSEESGTADLRICDITGKVLINKTIAVQKGQQTVSTNVGQLASGIYIVSFSQFGKTQTQKLTIIK